MTSPADKGLTAPGGKPRIERLKKRQEFLRAARGVRYATAGLILECCAVREPDCAIRVGFTASRKIGNAVARNRARRRLVAASQELLPLYGLPGSDYVLVARVATLTRPFAGLVGDLKCALGAAHARLDQLRTEQPR